MIGSYDEGFEECVVYLVRLEGCMSRVTTGDQKMRVVVLLW